MKIFIYLLIYLFTYGIIIPTLVSARSDESVILGIVLFGLGILHLINIIKKEIVK